MGQLLRQGGTLGDGWNNPGEKWWWPGISWWQWEVVWSHQILDIILKVDPTILDDRWHVRCKEGRMFNVCTNVFGLQNGKMVLGILRNFIVTIMISLWRISFREMARSGIWFYTSLCCCVVNELKSTGPAMKLTTSWKFVDVGWASIPVDLVQVGSSRVKWRHSCCELLGWTSRTFQLVEGRTFGNLEKRKKRVNFLCLVV